MNKFNVYWLPRKTKHLGKYSFKYDKTRKIANQLISFVAECETTNKCIATKDNFISWVKIKTGYIINNAQDILNSAYDAGIVDENGHCGKMKCYTLGPNAHHFLNGRLKIMIKPHQSIRLNDQVFVRN